MAGAKKEEHMRLAIELSRSALVEQFGGPFGAIVVRAGSVVGSGQNRVLLEKDPTAHAEIVAIRKACQQLGQFNLEGCELYTSCEPCPMCLGAIYWSRIDRTYFANTRADAAAIGFDDDFFYREIALPLDERTVPFEQLLHDEALAVFQQWNRLPEKRLY